MAGDLVTYLQFLKLHDKGCLDILCCCCCCCFCSIQCMLLYPATVKLVLCQIKDNAHNLNSPMEFNKNGYTCCLDTTKHDEIEKK